MSQITILAEMMGLDLKSSLEKISDLGIKYIDIKRHVFGRHIEDLNDDHRRELRSLEANSNATIYCFSSSLGHQNVSRTGESEFRGQMMQGIDNMLQTARYIRPHMIRLLACSFDERSVYSDSNEYLNQRAPWVYSAYGDAISQIHDAGIQVTIENEPNTILSSADETVGFFKHLDLDKVGFTWDVQNMWQSGTYPTVDVYRVLRSVINYVHLKGGQGAPSDPETFMYRSPLESASWPVIDIVTQVLADGVSPMICLNSSHGTPPTNYLFASLVGTHELVEAEVRRDVAFLRRIFGEFS